MITTITTTQTEFYTALLDSDHLVPPGLQDAAGRPAGRRFDVYRNNVAVSLTQALEDGFPVIQKLVGEENFKAIAGVFLRQSPPDSPMLMTYGATFPDFLRGFAPLAHLGYLGDVAGVELALRRSYHAADCQAVDGEGLAQFPPEQLEHLKLQLAPSVEVVTSDWPIHAIWAFNMIDGAPKPLPEAQDVLITRMNFDPKPHLLPAGGAKLLSALRLGVTLGDAATQALEQAPDFDLGALLAQLLTGQAIKTATL